MRQCLWMAAIMALELWDVSHSDVRTIMSFPTLEIQHFQGG